MTDSSEKLYRFFSVPGNISDLLTRDNIVLDSLTTIDDVLRQRVKLQKDLNQVIFLNPNVAQKKIMEDSLLHHNLPEPYFSLYKINYLLNKELLWVSKLDDLNDVSEYTKWTTSSYIEKMRLSEGRPLSKGEVEKTNKDLAITDGYLYFNPFEGASFYGVVSFCMGNNSPIMWAHYANGHSGICIGFDLDKSLMSPIQEQRAHSGCYNNQDDTPGLIHHWQKINYENSMPEIWDDGILQRYQSEYVEMISEDPSLVNHPIDGCSLAITNLINQKAPCWQQENELRLFLTGVEYNISLNKFISPTEMTPYLSLSDLYFGFNVNDQIQTLISNSVKKKLIYWQALPKGGTYDIKFLKI